jgi:hypothetical protein
MKIGMTPRTEVRGMRHLSMLQAFAWGVYASPHHTTPGCSSHPIRPAALSLLDEGRTPPLAGVGLLVGVYDAQEARMELPSTRQLTTCARRSGLNLSMTMSCLSTHASSRA